MDFACGLYAVLTLNWPSICLFLYTSINAFLSCFVLSFIAFLAPLTLVGLALWYICARPDFRCYGTDCQGSSKTSHLSPTGSVINSTFNLVVTAQN